MPPRIPPTALAARPGSNVFESPPFFTFYGRVFLAFKLILISLGGQKEVVFPKC